MVAGVTTVKLASGSEFDVKDGSSLLDAALSSGIVLPHSCKTGRCGSCKARVLSGNSHPFLPETSLTEYDLNNSWILACARSALSDIVLDVEEITGKVLPKARTFPCRIAGLEKLTRNVIRVNLRLPPKTNLEYFPGQYIDVIGLNGVRRSYSIACSHRNDNQLELHIAALEGGVMSNYWFQKAKLNDLLRLNGPLGTFFLRESSGLNLVFLATGTGIAPVKAILESIIELPSDQRPKSVTVLWGVRHVEDLYLDITTLLPNVKYLPVLSRANVGWNGARGYVQDVLFNLDLNFDKTAIYACGSDAMIQDAKKKLSDAGLPLGQFYSDAFVSSETN